VLKRAFEVGLVLATGLRLDEKEHHWFIRTIVAYIIAFGMINTLSMGGASRSWEMSAYVLCIVGYAEERRNTSHGER
jgi:hypothetical protein